MVKSNRLATKGGRCAFTLVELLVALAVIGILIGLLIPAVQSVRSAARKAACQNQMHQMGVALLNYHAAYKRFPYGSLEAGEHSWCSEILPFMELHSVYMDIDFNARWDSPRNQPISDTNIPTFVCPASMLRFDGKTDYGGIIGSVLSGLPPGNASQQAFGSGVLIRLTPRQPSPVRIPLIVDGTSHTMMVGEAVDRPRSASGSWANGFNVFSHDNGYVNSRASSGELQSWHSVGANAVFADGSVHLLNNTIDLFVLGAISTRNGREQFEKTW